MSSRTEYDYGLPEDAAGLGFHKMSISVEAFSKSYLGVAVC